VRQRLLISIFLVTQFLLSPVEADQTLTFTTPAAPPLSNSQQTGFIDLVVAEALTRIGYRLKVMHLPGERALINANSGIDDGELNRIAGLNKVYPNLVQVPEKTFEMEFKAFTRKQRFETNNWNSLRPYTVGIINGWKILERNVPPEVELIKVKNAEQLFALLQNNRVDVVLYGMWQGLNYIKNKHLQNIKILNPPLAKMEMYVYFHKKHSALVPLFSDTLRKMKSDGSYQRIYRRTLLPLSE
jgi:polar amino acid transport system substrate-binding protein